MQISQQSPPLPCPPGRNAVLGTKVNPWTATLTTKTKAATAHAARGAIFAVVQNSVGAESGNLPQVCVPAVSRSTSRRTARAGGCGIAGIRKTPQKRRGGREEERRKRKREKRFQDPFLKRFLAISLANVLWETWKELLQPPLDLMMLTSLFLLELTAAPFLTHP